jgi:F0F1-type ATP synthase membrane subunit c/vacuolar-type H+-ATPase subunit K
MPEEEPGKQGKHTFVTMVKGDYAGVVSDVAEDLLVKLNAAVPGLADEIFCIVAAHHNKDEAMAFFRSGCLCGLSMLVAAIVQGRISDLNLEILNRP